MRSVPALLLLTMCALVMLPPLGRVRAADAPPRAFREPVEAAAGTDVGLLVVTPLGVKVLDAAGRPLRTLWPPGESTWGRRRNAGQRPSPLWPGLTADTDFSGATYDADDIDDADDPRLADDTTGRPWDIDDAPARSRAGRLPEKTLPESPVRSPGPQLVAAAGDAGWVVRLDGLWRIDLRTGVASHAYIGDGSSIRALAARSTPAGVTTVALVDGDRVLRARSIGGGAAHDQFENLAGSVARVQGLAIGPGGAVMVLDGDGRLRAYGVAVDRANPGHDGGGGDGSELRFGDRVDDVVACASGALVLSDSSVFLVAAEKTRRLGPAPPGAERLACGSAGGGCAAFGAALNVSTDAGRTWRARPSPSIRPLRALIPTGAALWIAVPMGLWPLPAIEAGEVQAAQTQPEMDLRSAPTTSAGRRPTWPRTPDFWRRWAAVLPEVDIELELGRVGAVRDVRGMVAASFRLDGPWSGAVPARWRRRRPTDVTANGQPAIELDMLAIGASDPVAIDERRALARILEESP